MKTTDVTAIIDGTVSRCITELKLNGMLCQDIPLDTRIKKTKTLLFKYQELKSLREVKKHELEAKTNSIGQVSFSTSSVISFNTGDKIEVSDTEKQNQAIRMLENEIADLNYAIGTIDNALNLVKDEKHYDLIELRYFEGKTREELADMFNCDVKTIGRRDRKLIDKMSSYIFVKDYVTSLFTV